MIVINQPLLDFIKQFHSVCEYCGSHLPGQIAPNHVRCRGMGGGARLDVWLNLTMLCPACHAAYHAATIKPAELWAIIDWREGLPPGTAAAAVNTLLCRPKGSTRGRN